MRTTVIDRSIFLELPDWVKYVTFNPSTGWYEGWECRPFWSQYRHPNEWYAEDGGMHMSIKRRTPEGADIISRDGEL